MVKCLAQGHKCHGRDSNPHLLLTPELESGMLDRSATTWREMETETNTQFIMSPTYVNGCQQTGSLPHPSY